MQNNNGKRKEEGVPSQVNNKTFLFFSTKYDINSYIYNTTTSTTTMPTTIITTSSNSTPFYPEITSHPPLTLLPTITYSKVMRVASMFISATSVIEFVEGQIQLQKTNLESNVDF